MEATIEAPELIKEASEEYAIAKCIKQTAELLNDFIRKAKAQGLAVDVSTNIFLSMEDADAVTVKVGKMTYL